MAWIVVIAPTTWGLTYTVQNALKIFTKAPAAGCPSNACGKVTETVTLIDSQRDRSPLHRYRLLPGFRLWVGCALAVMYSIYMGGYRAAVKDASLPAAPERLIRELARLKA